MHVCTIIAKNYVPFARILARSFAEHHPGGRCSVLIIDSIEGHIEPADEPFEILRPGDIDCPAFEAMATIYDVLELSTAVKPWLLRHLLRQSGPEGVVYLDPDIRVFAPLTELETLTRAHGLVINPHVVTPIPRDGLRPNEQFLMLAGTYNLGFLSIGPGSQSERLLDWWCERLRHDCLLDPPRGYFVDQRWFDLLPSVVESFHVLRDPGYNVAYWNLHGTRVELVEGRYLAGGRPLRFFHFSGFDPDRPDRLSLHQDRIDLGREPVLLELCRAYAEELRRFGFPETRHWSYDYATLPDGTGLDPPLRRLFRKVELNGDISPAPFTPAGLRTFFDSLNEPASPDAPAGVTRLIQAIYRERIDVQRAFPHIEGDDGAAFLRWVREHGPDEFSLPDALLPPSGVNVAGNLRSEPPVKREPPTDHAWRAIEIMSSGPAQVGASRFGRPGDLLRRLLLRAMRPLAVYQRQVDKAIVDAIIALRESTDRSRENAAVSLQQAELLRHARRQSDSISALEPIARNAERLIAETRALPYMHDPPFEVFDGGARGQVYGYRADAGAVGRAHSYLGFQEIFRGPDELITERQRVYLDLVADRPPVLDAGCGRGEFLDVLRNGGIEALGVDIDASMVERCRSKGHSAERSEVKAYLERVEEGIFGAIFCAQVIEHMPARELESFLRLALSRLRSDGLLIAETINPHSVPALKTFWVDLSRQHPVFPEVALQLVRAAGFRSAYVFHPNGKGDVEADRFEQGEYALIARR